MAGLDVVVVGAAVESEMPGSCGLAAVGVIGRFVSSKNVGAVVDLDVVVEFVDVAVFFLLDGADDGAVLELGHGSAGTDRGWGGSGRIARVRLRICGGIFARKPGIFGKQLAGY